MHRPILLVGGAPKLSVDALRYLSVRASGRTALQVYDLLAEQALTLQAAAQVQLLLPDDVTVSAAQGVACLRYTDRASLDAQLDAYLRLHPEALILMSAAVNDYQVAGVLVSSANADADGASVQKRYAPGEKIPSGAAKVSIELEPAAKLIDSLAGRGHRGPLIACKYEAADTLLASAQALQQRVGAHLVLANSLCGTRQALLSADGVKDYPDRASLVQALAQQIAAAAHI